MIREALGIRRKFTAKKSHPEVASSIEDSDSITYERGEYDKAVAQLRDAIGDAEKAAPKRRIRHWRKRSTTSPMPWRRSASSTRPSR